MATLLPALAGWIVGMLVAFHPMITSRAALIQGDWADTRSNNYILDVRIHPGDSTLAPAVARWVAQNNLDPRLVCVLRLPPPPPG